MKMYLVNGPNGCVHCAAANKLIWFDFPFALIQTALLLGIISGLCDRCFCIDIFQV